MTKPTSRRTPKSLPRTEITEGLSMSGNRLWKVKKQQLALAKEGEVELRPVNGTELINMCQIMLLDLVFEIRVGVTSDLLEPILNVLRTVDRYILRRDQQPDGETDPYRQLKDAARVNDAIIALKTNGVQVVSNTYDYQGIPEHQRIAVAFVYLEIPQPAFLYANPYCPFALARPEEPHGRLPFLMKKSPG